MKLFPEMTIEAAELPETPPGVFSLGLIFPFQPSMVEIKTVRGILNFTLEVVQTKLESNYSADEIKTTVQRLKKIFSKLNYNSHRKSVAIVIDGDDEKIIYPNYRSNLVFFFNVPFSLLDLVADSARNPEFELLILNEKKAELYEYFNNSIHKAFAQTNESCNDKKPGSECLLQKISNVIKHVNKNNEKPVFILSDDDEQTNKFCKFFPYSEIVFKTNIASDGDWPSKMKLASSKIINQWDYWHSKLVKGQIAIAERSQSLSIHFNSVHRALQEGTNGLLLVDRSMKESISKRRLVDETFFVSNHKLEGEIEKFLARGNRVQITEPGLLENVGGIALIKDMQSPFQSYRNHRRLKEEDFLN